MRKKCLCLFLLVLFSSMGIMLGSKTSEASLVDALYDAGEKIILEKASGEQVDSYLGADIKIPAAEQPADKLHTILVFDKNNNPLDLTKYSLVTSYNGVDVMPFSTNAELKMGRLRIPGNTVVYMYNASMPDRKRKIVAINYTGNSVISADDVLSANGNPLRYNTPYYINDTTTANGGIISQNNFLYTSSDPNNLGDPIIFQKSSDPSSSGFINWSDSVYIKSVKDNKYWSRGYEWSGDLAIELSSSPSDFYLSSNGTKRTIGFSYVTSEVVIITVVFNMKRIYSEPGVGGNGPRLRGGKTYLMGTDLLHDFYDKLYSTLRRSQPNSFNVYEVN
jgi:hypothetical protein